MVASKTLLIRHMPSDFSLEEKEDFLKHFGAVGIKVIGSKYKKSNNVFAVFETHKAAEAALKRLHQTELLGQLLAVEFARGEDHLTDYNSNSQKNEKEIIDKTKEKTQKYYENFLYRLSSWASEVDFNIPPPVHLKYQYPPPSRKVLENIANVLATVPKFYTQVLHLMNKMNLPCPFIEPFPIVSDLFDKKNDTNEQMEENVETIEELSTEEESEIESDQDDSVQKINIIPSKRNIPERKRKTKRPKFIKPTTNKMPSVSKNLLKTEEVFEVREKEPMVRKIEVKITPDLSSIHEAEETQKAVGTVEGFEKLPASESTSNDVPDSKQNMSTEEDETVGSCITEQELAANRIPARDQRILPVFKNYQPGAPSCRLYIKNLAKQVQTRDLHYIYRRYLIPDLEEQGTMFDIRLMQEGRMKGQAFINLQSVELAQKALKETNGFILKDKPMVVQFARSSKAK